MLKELGITNFAIIDRLNLAFHDGLNVISGETGAGKSILIGAIGLLLGERASSDLIRSDEDAAIVEAAFDIGPHKLLKTKLHGMGFRPGRELVVKRVVSRSGKNRVYIDGNLATVAMLGEISEALVNICSQHEHQVLLDPESHIDILDEFGNLGPQRSAFTALYEEHQGLKARLDELAAKNRNRAEREEFLRFQVGEIEKAALKPGEDALSSGREENSLERGEADGARPRVPRDPLRAGGIGPGPVEPCDRPHPGNPPHRSEFQGLGRGGEIACHPARGCGEGPAGLPE